MCCTLAPKQVSGFGRRRRRRRGRNNPFKHRVPCYRQKKKSIPSPDGWMHTHPEPAEEGRGRGERREGRLHTRTPNVLRRPERQTDKHCTSRFRSSNLADAKHDPVELKSGPIYLSIHPSIHRGLRDHHRAKRNPSNKGGIDLLHQCIK